MAISPAGVGPVGAAAKQTAPAHKTPAHAAKNSQGFADLLKRLLDGQGAAAVGQSHKAEHSAPAAQAPAVPPVATAGVNLRA